MITFIRSLPMKRPEGRRPQSWGLFLCSACNGEFELRLSQRKRNKSCGCDKNHLCAVAKTKHGSAPRGNKTHLYKTWCKMKERCNNPNIEHYPEYGGRGIKLCGEWENDFPAFEAWAKVNGYQRHLEIDRRENDLGYSPDNCRWVTQTVNKRNRRTTRLSMDLARYIRAEYASGRKTAKELRLELEISDGCLYSVLSGKTWQEGKE